MLRNPFLVDHDFPATPDTGAEPADEKEDPAGWEDEWAAAFGGSDKETSKPVATAKAEPERADDGADFFADPDDKPEAGPARVEAKPVNPPEGGGGEDEDFFADGDDTDTEPDSDGEENPETSDDDGYSFDWDDDPDEEDPDDTEPEPTPAEHGPRRPIEAPDDFDWGDGDDDAESEPATPADSDDDGLAETFDEFDDGDAKPAHDPRRVLIIVAAIIMVVALAAGGVAAARAWHAHQVGRERDAACTTLTEAAGRWRKAAREAKAAGVDTGVAPDLTCSGDADDMRARASRVSTRAAALQRATVDALHDAWAKTTARLQEAAQRDSMASEETRKALATLAAHTPKTAAELKELDKQADGLVSKADGEHAKAKADQEAKQREEEAKRQAEAQAQAEARQTPQYSTPAPQTQAPATPRTTAPSTPAPAPTPAPSAPGTSDVEM